MCKASKYLSVVIAAVLLVAPGAFAHELKGTMTVRTNHQSGVFGVGPLSNKNSASLTGGSFQGQIFNVLDEEGFADFMEITWNNGSGQSVDFEFAPYGVDADVTPGSACFVSSSSLVANGMFGEVFIDNSPPCSVQFGTVSISSVRIRYSELGKPYIVSLSGTLHAACSGQSSQPVSSQDTFDAVFSLTGSGIPSSNLLTDTPPFTNFTKPTAANPSCFSPNSGSGGGGNGGGGGGGGNGGGGGGGSNPVGIFPGFTGFGPGASGGGTGGGTGSGTGTPILSIDIGFDMEDGVPSLENTDQLDLPLLVLSSGLSDKVTLTASSDPEGLDFSFDNDVLPSNNDFSVPVLTITPKADALPRDYLVTVTASSGDKQSSTSFLVSLACDPPFISSLATSQPQSQTITPGKTAKLAVSALGTGPFAYQWYRGTTGNTQFPVTGATNREFTTPALQNSETYWVRVSNSCGTSDSNPATVTVH